MTDHSRIPNDADWQRCLDELDDLIANIRRYSGIARARAREKAVDGYPRNSMPEGSIGGIGGDPTGNTVVLLEAGVHDPVAHNTRSMIRSTTAARNLLRGANASMQRALPPTTTAPIAREVCQSCGVPKHLAGEWVKAEGRCRACARRRARLTLVDGTA